MPRDDDFEEFGEDMGLSRDEEENEGGPERLTSWTHGTIGRCPMCSLVGGIPEECRNEEGEGQCPQCGTILDFLVEDQSLPNMEMIDLTRGWRPGTTGRCDFCGFIGRVFPDVAREDGTAACEMCGKGTFQFIYGLPNSGQRAPAPRPDYKHEIDGLVIYLPRRVEEGVLSLVLEKLREGMRPEDLLNTQDESLRATLDDNGIKKSVIVAIRKEENIRRWESHEPLLYCNEEKERLNKFVMLRVPLNGRMKIAFAGARGPIIRWVRPEIFTALQDGTRTLVFDGHYKAPETERTREEQRFVMAKQVYPKCNALLGRGVLRAWSATGEEVPVEGGDWSGEQASEEPEC